MIKIIPLPETEYTLTPDTIDFGQVVVLPNGNLCIKINDPQYSVEKKFQQDLMLNLVTGKKGWAAGWTTFKAIPNHRVEFTTDKESKIVGNS